MIASRVGKVVQVVQSRRGATEMVVQIGDDYAAAVAYHGLAAEPRVGDELLLNTTAVDMNLGTGGRHFVLANLSRPGLNLSGPGHILKLRYTPLQLRVLATEEPDSPYHEAVNDCTSLEGMPVVCVGLHSMLAPVAAAYKRVHPGHRIAYIMTDAGALPLGVSKLVPALQERGLIAEAVTAGHAFGGDFEAVGVPSALAIARAVLRADMVIAGMGPGNVGTGTRWGTTALEVGTLVNTVHVLEGRPIAALRISFADPRLRHQGVSHHSLTALGALALAPAEIAVPELPPSRARHIRDQLEDSGIIRRHRVRWVPTEPLHEALEQVDDLLDSMGRLRRDDPEFFLAAAAAGHLAALEEQAP
jgi:hypothetical protein